MKAFIITMLVLRGLDIVFRLIFLGTNEYPRRSNTEPHIDVLVLIIGVCLFAWGWSTLP